jgi:hypothetical protein
MGTNYNLYICLDNFWNHCVAEFFFTILRSSRFGKYDVEDRTTPAEAGHPEG